MKRPSAKLLVISAIGITTLGLGGTTVSAISRLSKPEKLAELTGESVDEITAEKYSTGKTYGEIADEHGVLNEFQEYNRENRQDAIRESVDNGTLPEEKAEIILQHIADQQASCDGTGYQNHTNQNHSHYNYDSYYNQGSHAHGQLHQGHGRHNR